MSPRRHLERRDRRISRTFLESTSRPGKQRPHSRGEHKHAQTVNLRKTARRGNPTTKVIDFSREDIVGNYQEFTKDYPIAQVWESLGFNDRGHLEEATPVAARIRRRNNHRLSYLITARGWRSAKNWLPSWRINPWSTGVAQSIRVTTVPSTNTKLTSAYYPVHHEIRSPQGRFSSSAVCAVQSAEEEEGSVPAMAQRQLWLPRRLFRYLLSTPDIVYWSAIQASLINHYRRRGCTRPSFSHVVFAPPPFKATTTVSSVHSSLCHLHAKPFTRPSIIPPCSPRCYLCNDLTTIPRAPVRVLGTRRKRSVWVRWDKYFTGFSEVFFL